MCGRSAVMLLVSHRTVQSETQSSSKTLHSPVKFQHPRARSMTGAITTTPSFHLLFQILDVIDCTGSGDIDTSTLVKADEQGTIQAAAGREGRLVLNTTWVNPTGELAICCCLIQ